MIRKILKWLGIVLGSLIGLLVMAIITEKGILEKPFGKYIKLLFSGKRASDNTPH